MAAPAQRETRRPKLARAATPCLQAQPGSPAWPVAGTLLPRHATRGDSTMPCLPPPARADPSQTLQKSARHRGHTLVPRSGSAA